MISGLPLWFTTLHSGHKSKRSSFLTVRSNRNRPSPGGHLQQRQLRAQIFTGIVVHLLAAMFQFARIILLPPQQQKGDPD